MTNNMLIVYIWNVEPAVWPYVTVIVILKQGVNSV